MEKLFIIFLFFINYGCEKPPESKYKSSSESIQSGHKNSSSEEVNAATTGDAAKEGIVLDPEELLTGNKEVDLEDPQAQLIQTGNSIYQQRCSSCHLPITISQRTGRTAAQIIEASAVIEHQNIEWPNQDEALALEAALGS